MNRVPTVRRLLTATLLAAVVTTGLGATASHATARDLGGVMWSTTKGGAETLLSITTEKGCAPEAKRVSAVIYGKGLPADGQVVVAPSTLLYSATQPMTLPLSNAFVIYANRNTTALTGTYKLTVKCTDRFGVSSLGEFETSMKWKTPGNSLKNIEKATFVATNTAVVEATEVAPPRDGLPPVPTEPDAPAPTASAAATTPAAPAPAASAPAGLPTESLAAAPPSVAAAEGTSGSSGGNAAPQILAIFAAFALLAGAGWWIFRRREGAA